MNFIEHYNSISTALKVLSFKMVYIGKEDFAYQTSHLEDTRFSINLVEQVPYLEQEVTALKDSWLFQSKEDNLQVSATDGQFAERVITSLKTKLTTFQEIAESSELLKSTGTILIRIPEIHSFENLEKYANDLKKAIEIPIVDQRAGGEVTIVGADEGSVILYVSLGVMSAVKLIAAICWASVVIKKKKAEAKIFEEHAKSLGLKNEALSDILEAQKVQLKNIIEAEATAIANKEYNHKEPETIERLKLSIATIAELVEKGITILPVSKDEGINKSFPDYNDISLIESTIKQITSKD